MFSSTNELAKQFSIQKRAFERSPSPDYGERLDRISRVMDFVLDEQKEIVKASVADWLHKPEVFVKALEIMTVINHGKYVRKRLKRWMRRDVRRANFPFNVTGAKAYIEYQPLGVVGVMVPWNGPVAMCMVAAIDAFAAGNRVMVKISEFSPATAEFLAATISKYFSDDEFMIVTGELDVSKAFSELPFDHLMYTGSANTAKHIMAAAAANLTPVTLELGGKSPVIVDDSADINRAAQRAVSGRLINSGQACITPDYVLIEHKNLDAFVQEAENSIRRMYPKEREGIDYIAIATDLHFQRLKSLHENTRATGAKIIEIDIGASEEKRQFSPLIVVNPPDDSRVLTEEIFGPILVVKSVPDIDAAIDYINGGDRPLALYYFGENQSNKEKVLKRTHSGGVGINEVLMQQMMSDLPFGGVGHSGMGSYWGADAGFKRFSHAKSIFEKGWFNKLATIFDPPYGALFDRFIKIGLKK